MVYVILEYAAMIDVTNENFVLYMNIRPESHIQRICLAFVIPYFIFPEPTRSQFRGWMDVHPQLSQRFEMQFPIRLFLT